MRVHLALGSFLLFAVGAGCAAQDEARPLEDGGGSATHSFQDAGDAALEDGGLVTEVDTDAGTAADEDAGQTPEPDAGSVPEADAGQTPEPDAGSLPEPDAGSLPEPDAGETGPLANQTLSLRLAENSPNGTPVLTATSVDAGVPVVIVAITSGNTAGAFELNAGGTSLQVASSAALDFETRPSFNLVLELASTTVPPRTGTLSVALSLDDVNEAPVLSGGPFRTVPPLANGRVLGTLSVVDPDPSQTHSFSITAGNADGIFAVDASTGALSLDNVAAVTSGSHVLTVRATDNGNPPLSDELQVEVFLEAAPTAVADGPVQVVPAGAPAALALLSNDTVVSTAQVTHFGGGILGGTVTSYPADGSSVAFPGGTVSIDGSGQLTVVLSSGQPGFGTFSYRLAGPGGTSDAVVTLQTCLNLTAGQAYTGQPGTALCVANTGGSNAEHYLIPSNLSQDAGYTPTVTVAGVSGSGTSPVNAASVSVVDDHLTNRHPVEHLAFAAQLLMGADAGLPPSNGVHIPRGTTPPVVGDLWTLNAQVGRDCDAGVSRTGSVVHVGQHVIAVADDLRPAGGFTTGMQDGGFTAIANTFDTLIYPAVTELVGEPSDIDGNGKVVLFFTGEMNALSPPASSLAVFASHKPRDLFPQEICPTSNAGEIIYLGVPDPIGTINSNVRTVSYMQGSVPINAAHELTHLALDSRRMYVNGQTTFEDTWLEEAFASLVEERLFYKASGLTSRQNIILSMLNTGPTASQRVAAFNTYVNPNFTRYRTWMQKSANYGATAFTDTLAHRGAGWAFMRYVADRAPGDDAAFLYSLANASGESFSKLGALIGAEPRVWLGDYLTAVLMDDWVIGTAPEHRMLSWNFRSVYGGLGGFPLYASGNLADNVPVPVPLAAGGGAAYIRIDVPSGGIANVNLTPPAAGQPAAFTVTRRN